MTVTLSLKSGGLPESVRQFADQERGLIVFSGPDADSGNAPARALADYVAERTGRPLSVVTSRQTTRARTKDGAVLVLVDGHLNADALLQAVEAAWAGALVIAATRHSAHPYSWLIDLLLSAEDWDIRPKFDAVLYAVVQAPAPDSGDEGDA